jgi:excisionase family DNA binding protein
MRVSAAKNVGVRSYHRAVGDGPGSLAAEDGQPSPEERVVLVYVGVLLTECRRRFQRNGVSWPVQLEAAWLLATGRQKPPELDRPDHSADVVAMTYAEAARRLSVSGRTVERLVRSGALPTVGIGGCPRIRVGDLVGYVERRPLRPVDRLDSSVVAGCSGRAALP